MAVGALHFGGEEGGKEDGEGVVEAWFLFLLLIECPCVATGDSTVYGGALSPFHTNDIATTISRTGRSNFKMFSYSCQLNLLKNFLHVHSKGNM